MVIRKRRTDLGLTQESLAEKAGFHWTYVSGVERGVRNISVLKLLQLAKALNTTASNLLNGL
jgi:transcriptional regulator with XRE-family HTH domain